MVEENKQITDKFSEKMDLAWSEFQNCNFENAEAICNELSIDFSESLEPFFLLGHIYFEQDKLAEALEQYSKALEKDKERKVGGYINYWIGSVYDKYSLFGHKSQIYDSSKAKEYYYNAKKYEAYPSDVIYKLQYDYRSHSDKIKLYEEGISKFPNEIPFYILLSDTFKRLDNSEKQIGILNDAIEKGLKSASLYFNIGEFHFYNSQFSKSREFFIEALNLNKQYPKSNYAINYAVANSFFNEADFDNAEKYYRKSFEESINDGTCLFGFFGLIIVYWNQNKIQEAQKLISEIVIDKTIFFEESTLDCEPFWLDTHFPESIALLQNVKQIYIAFKSLKFSNKNEIFSSKVWLIRALLAKHLGRLSDRYTAIKNALKYLPAYQYEFLYAELSLAFSDLFYQKIEKKQDIRRIIGFFKSDLEKYPTTFQVHSIPILDAIIGAIFKLKYYKDIVEIYRFFNHDQITKVGVWFEVGYSLNELNEPGEAKKAYEKHIELNGGSSASSNNLANIYKAEGNLLKAIELYKFALAIDPTDEIPKNNLSRTVKQLENIENEKNQKKAIDTYFKSAIGSLRYENNFVLDKLSKFILNIKTDDNFKDWAAPIPKYKFPLLMGTDKQKAESLRIQWLDKKYIQESDRRDAHNVVIYFINPYLEKEIAKINNTKIPDNWISGFSNLSIGKLEELGYFDLIARIRKVNKKFKLLFERDFNELVFNYIVQNEKTTIVLSGSLVELALTYHCEKKKIYQVQYVDYKGIVKNKKLYDCVLNDLILYAENHLFFGSDFLHLSNLSRIYRNFIHPGRELKDKLDKSKCDLCFMSTTEILRKIL